MYFPTISLCIICSSVVAEQNQLKLSSKYIIYKIVLASNPMKNHSFNIQTLFKQRKTTAWSSTLTRDALSWIRLHITHPHLPCVPGGTWLNSRKHTRRCASVCTTADSRCKHLLPRERLGNAQKKSVCHCVWDTYPVAPVVQEQCRVQSIKAAVCNLWSSMHFFCHICVYPFYIPTAINESIAHSPKIQYLWQACYI